MAAAVVTCLTAVQAPTPQSAVVATILSLSTAFPDVVHEAAGDGFDTVIATNSFSLIRNEEIEVIGTADANGTGSNILSGSSAAQTIVGNAGTNFIEGGGGIDHLYGLADNDVLWEVTTRITSTEAMAMTH